MEVLFVQIFLGVGLFFIINWIGSHSYSIGYIEISMFAKSEEAPAFNFLIRALTPAIYLVIISSIFYYLKFDKYVLNIYFVSVYYLAFRLLFNLATNKALLLNWVEQIVYWVAIIIISYFTYDKFIKIKANILPDFTNIANELWIIILIFLYQVANNIKRSSKNTVKRKNNYTRTRYMYFKKLYGENIKSIMQNEALEGIGYAILIYEDFNRPKPLRWIETLRFIFTKKPHTLGVMQVLSDRYITDKESVELGMTKIKKAHEKYLSKSSVSSEDSYEWSVMNEIISDYNVGNSYYSEVSNLVEYIKENFYKNTKDTLKVENVR